MLAAYIFLVLKQILSKTKLKTAQTRPVISIIAQITKISVVAMGWMLKELRLSVMKLIRMMPMLLMVIIPNRNLFFQMLTGANER